MADSLFRFTLNTGFAVFCELLTAICLLVSLGVFAARPVEYYLDRDCKFRL